MVTNAAQSQSASSQFPKQTASRVQLIGIVWRRHTYSVCNKMPVIRMPIRRHMMVHTHHTTTVGGYHLFSVIWWYKIKIKLRCCPPRRSCACCLPTKYASAGKEISKNEMKGREMERARQRRNWNLCDERLMWFRKRRRKKNGEKANRRFTAENPYLFPDAASTCYRNLLFLASAHLIFPTL